IGDYKFMDLFTPIAQIGVPYQGANGLTPNTIYTPDLAWQETRKFEVGLELGFLKDRILFSTSFYLNQSTNQLTNYNLPNIDGFSAVQKNLNAVVQNKGWEFTLNTVNITTGQFKWTSTLIVSLNRNTLKSGAPGLSPSWQQYIGKPLSAMFYYKFLGVDPFTGLYQIAGADGKPTTSPTSADKTAMVNFEPDFFGGLQNSFSYKGFSLEFLIQFAKEIGNNYLYNYIPGTFTNTTGGNQPATVLSRWQTPGDASNIQKFSQNFSVFNPWTYAQQSNQPYGDASYLKLQNVSLSWQLPDRWKQSMHMKNARVYAQGENLFAITPLHGLGIEGTLINALPPLRMITFGVQVTL
ncbi:MAG TPA: hypothetical protein VK622_05185, partial [Puia sp.]|nr:hypothetical protein [Puia sp.]